MTRRKQWTLRRTIQKEDCKNKIAFLCRILCRKQDLVSQCVNIIQQWPLLSIYSDASSGGDGGCCDESVAESH